MPRTCEAWGDQQTAYYRLRRIPCDSAQEFFDVAPLRDPQWIYPEYASFLVHNGPENVEVLGPGSSQVRELLNLLKSAQFIDHNGPTPRGEGGYKPRRTLLDQAVKLMLQFLGMESGHTMVRVQQPVWLHQQGQYQSLTLDTAVMDESLSSYVLISIIDRALDCYFCNPFGQLMAAAVAVFQSNNSTRHRKNVPPLKAMIIPGMIWSKGIPSFYRIKVTEELADCVNKGTRPFNDTLVYEFTPRISEALHCYGLWRMETRVKIMKYMENIKDFCPLLGNHAPSGWIRLMSDEELGDLNRGVEDLPPPLVFETNDPEDS